MSNTYEDLEGCINSIVHDNSMLQEKLLSLSGEETMFMRRIIVGEASWHLNRLSMFFDMLESIMNE